MLKLKANERAVKMDLQRGSCSWWPNSVTDRHTGTYVDMTLGPFTCTAIELNNGNWFVGASTHAAKLGGDKDEEYNSLSAARDFFLDRCTAILQGIVTGAA